MPACGRRSGPEPWRPRPGAPGSPAPRNRGVPGPGISGGAAAERRQDLRGGERLLALVVGRGEAPQRSEVSRGEEQDEHAGLRPQVARQQRDPDVAEQGGPDVHRDQADGERRHPFQRARGEERDAEHRRRALRELGRRPLHQTALVADRPEGAQRAHRLKALEDLAGKLRHLVHLAPADGLGAEAGHRHVDRNDRCRQREQHADHPAGREDHREDHGRRQARGDRPPLVVAGSGHRAGGAARRPPRRPRPRSPAHPRGHPGRARPGPRRGR